MPSKHFASMVDAIARAFGREGHQLKETPEALYLRSPEGLVYAFFEDTSRLSSGTVKRLLTSGAGDLSHLVVLSLQPLPAETEDALEEAGASVVAGERFHRLLEGLELSGFVEGSSPSGPQDLPETERRVLPTADRLDQTMERARLWMAWEVPAIALRFYEEAVRSKPAYVPAQVGKGSALVALGACDPAEEAFEEALAHSPGNEEARVGLARVTGLRGDADGEIEELQALLKEDASRSLARAHLVAALVERGRWKEAKPQVEVFLASAPQEPYFHALAALCAERLGDKEEASREHRAADVLGMRPEAWTELKARAGASDPKRPGGPARSSPSAGAKPRGSPSVGRSR